MGIGNKHAEQVVKAILAEPPTPEKYTKEVDAFARLLEEDNRYRQFSEELNPAVLKVKHALEGILADTKRRAEHATASKLLNRMNALLGVERAS